MRLQREVWTWVIVRTALQGEWRALNARLPWTTMCMVHQYDASVMARAARAAAAFLHSCNSSHRRRLQKPEDSKFGFSEKCRNNNYHNRVRILKN